LQRLPRAPVSPDDGAVTENVFDAEPPGATVPRLTWPAGDSVQPDGTLIDTAAADSGRLVGLRSVARTVNVPSASVDDEIAASVGCGGVGCPYTAGEYPGLATGCTGTPPAWLPMATRLTWSRPPPAPPVPQTAIARVLAPWSFRIPAGT
jgi:hypothetical protein